MAFPPLDRALVVGSLGSWSDLRSLDVGKAGISCDILEIRLDSIASETAGAAAIPWSRLKGMPLLCTARRMEEGGSGDWDANRRIAMLNDAMAHASCLDIEVASIPAMTEVINRAAASQVPWIASFHDFTKIPEPAALRAAADEARRAGAAAFKVAGRVNEPADLLQLVAFQQDSHGLPVATMGMGPLAPVSRLLCAQHGSVLNYGYLGSTPTAPGQWEAGFLREAIRKLAPL